MVAFALLFFLLLISIMTAVAIMTALKAVDFMDETRAFHEEMAGLEAKLDEIIRLLAEPRGGAGPGRDD
ncbi:MAG: hypothetical protein PHN82_04440 [bacterium]|nr:hypothetical protein [bacterium]